MLPIKINVRGTICLCIPEQNHKGFAVVRFSYLGSRPMYFQINPLNPSIVCRCRSKPVKHITVLKQGKMVSLTVLKTYLHGPYFGRISGKSRVRKHNLPLQQKQ